MLVPGQLPVRIEVTETSGFLDSLGVMAVRFATGTIVAEAIVDFDSAVGDTALTLTLQLESLPTNTQLNLQARAWVSELSATSEEVLLIAIHCTDLPPGTCP